MCRQSGSELHADDCHCVPTWHTRTLSLCKSSAWIVQCGHLQFLILRDILHSKIKRKCNLAELSTTLQIEKNLFLIKLTELYLRIGSDNCLLGNRYTHISLSACQSACGSLIVLCGLTLRTLKRPGMKISKCADLIASFSHLLNI